MHEKPPPATGAIAAGARVRFTGDDGPRSGVVKNFVRDLINGQRFAIIELDGPVPGLFETVATVDLDAERASR